MSLPDSTEIDPRYRIDLTRIFEPPADWDDARKALAADIESFAATQRRELRSTADLAALADELAALCRRKASLELYAELSQHTRDDPAADDRMRRFRALEREFDEAVATGFQTLRETDDARFDDLVASLDERRHYAENLREQATYRRSPEVEDAVGAFAEARSAPDRTILAVTTEDLSPPTLERPDGTTVEVTYGRYRQEVSRPDRAFRRRVYETFHDELARFESTLATAYAEKLKAASALADVREFDSLRQAQFHHRAYPESGLTASLPTEVHDAMLAAVRENLGPRERERQVRAEALGIDRVRPWDRTAPLLDVPEPDVPFEAARDHVVAAMAPLGQAYQERVRSFFAERRVDAFEYAGKRNDIPAYCPSSATDGAFVLMNFQEDVRSTFYLAHELGHAMHVAHHREGPAMYATCPRPLEEIPSFLHELLLVEHFLDETGTDGPPGAGEDGALAGHALTRLVRCIEGNFYGAATWSASQHRLATAVDRGEDLDADRIADAFLDVHETFDPAIPWSERDRKGWLLGSMIREPYHSYQYVLGMTGALAVRDQLASGALSPADYRQFLRETGRRPAVESFDRLGLDVRTAEPYERAADRFERYLEEVEVKLARFDST